MTPYRDVVQPRNFSPENIKAHLPPEDFKKPCFSRIKTERAKSHAYCFATPMRLRTDRRNAKNKSTKGSTFVFRFVHHRQINHRRNVAEQNPLLSPEIV